MAIGSQVVKVLKVPKVSKPVLNGGLLMNVHCGAEDSNLPKISFKAGFGKDFETEQLGGNEAGDSD